MTLNFLFIWMQYGQCPDFKKLKLAAYETNSNFMLKRLKYITVKKKIYI